MSWICKTVARTRGTLSPVRTLDEVTIRPARGEDQQSIVALVRSERLNPTDLRWPRFVVAESGGRLIGAVQLRHHRDGALELGSLVVTAGERGRGVATTMIDALLRPVQRPVHMITDARHSAHYARWGFASAAGVVLPRSVRRNWRIGRLMGLISFVRRQRRKRLVVLVRA